MAIQLVAIDMDGTLLTDELEVSPRTVAAIQAAQQQGVTVTIATGRMFQSAKPFAERLGVDVPLITYNGALVKSCRSGEVWHEELLPMDTTLSVLAYFRERGWYIQTYVDDEFYVRDYSEEARTYEAVSGISPHVVGEAMFAPAKEPLKLLTLAEPEHLDAITPVLQERFGSKVCLTRAKNHMIEMVNSEVNKGRGVAMLAKRLGILQQDIMVLGDSENDMTMLAYAGLGVAMDNADDKVKAVADAVTADNNRDGVALAIEKYVLK